MSPEWRDVIVALAGAVSGGSVLGAVRYAQKRRQPPARHECVPSADLATLSEKVAELEVEVIRLRDWRHEHATIEGAARMVPALMAQTGDLRERVAKLEASCS